MRIVLIVLAVIGVISLIALLLMWLMMAGMMTGEMGMMDGNIGMSSCCSGVGWLLNLMIIVGLIAMILLAFRRK